MKLINTQTIFVILNNFSFCRCGKNIWVCAFIKCQSLVGLFDDFEFFCFCVARVSNQPNKFNSFLMVVLLCEF